MKIDAAKLLLENVDDTFVTPVFNGSASLRNAAGTLVEQAVKNGYRKKDTDDAFITQLYSGTIALYHLDKSAVVDPDAQETQAPGSESGESAEPAQPGTESSQGKTSEPLPQTAKALLYCVAIAWVGIAVVWLVRKIKERR